MIFGSKTKLGTFHEKQKNKTRGHIESIEHEMTLLFVLSTLTVEII
jgi:hypothetical protein